MGARRLGGPLAMAVAAVLALGAAACGDDDGDADGGTDGAFSVATMLEQIPADAVTDPADTPIQVVVGDLDRAAEIAGVERPEEVEADAVFDWIGPLTGVRAEGTAAAALLPPEVVGIESLARLDEFVDEVGWSLLDVHQYVELQQPPQYVSVLTGGFDEAEIDGAQGDRTDDIWSLGGEDFAMSIAERSAARPLGNAMRTALVDDRLVVARSTPPVRSAVDGADDTLADDGALAAVAGALDDQNVYGALLVSVDPGQSPSGGEGTEGLAPFDALGVGNAADEEGAVVVLAYAHAAEDGAEANVGKLRALFTEGVSLATNRPWSDLLALDDVTRDGTTVTATLRLAGDTNSMVGYQAVFQRDSFTVPG